jgi:hypothetical protein
MATRWMRFGSANSIEGLARKTSARVPRSTFHTLDDSARAEDC